MSSAESRRAIDAVWRIESAKVIAALARIVRDVGLAEELAQDALVSALEQWPQTGVPRNPGAWLTAVGKRRAVDLIRRQETYGRKLAELGREIERRPPAGMPEIEAIVDERIEDDLLRLMFLTCHPVLTTRSRVALTLRLLGGLTAGEIGRAFLLAEATVARRILRAKQTLAEQGVPFEVPAGDELLDRLESVLEVIYLIFNEGYTATAGDGWLRPALCAEALRLGRVLAGLLPAEPEVHGLVALMEFQHSRAAARTGPGGEPVRLLDQDRGRWDRLLIGRGLAALDRAAELGGADGPYALQAAIAACHARARTAAETDWIGLAAHYETLARTAPSAVVELNRAVALGMAYGPAVGLAHLDELAAADPGLGGYHLLPSVRGDLLARLGRNQEARAEFAAAAALARNERERTLLLGRAGDL